MQYNDYVQDVFGSESGVWKWSQHGIYKPGSNEGPFRYNNKIYRMNYVLESIPDAHKKDQQALDLGCGGGIFLPALERKGYQVTGVDISTNMIAMAKELCVSVSLKVDLIVGDCNKTGFQSNLFDVCICVGLIEHQMSDDVLLKEAYRILKPGGVLIITIRNYLCPHVRFQYAINNLVQKMTINSKKPNWKNKFKKTFDSRQHNPIKFRKSLRIAGFDFIRSRYSHFYFLPFPLNRMFPWIEAWAGKRLERLNGTLFRGLGSTGIYIVSANK